MKVITTVARILVGLLFIFSGIIKSNDPKGTGIKLNEYFDVFSSSFSKPYDSIVVKVTNAEYEIADSCAFPVNELENVFEFQINQSKPMMTKFEEDEDSTFGSTVYFNKKSETLYSYYYELDDSVNMPEMKLTVSMLHTGKKVLDKTVKFSSLTKHEIEEKVNLSAEVVKQSFWVGFFKSLKPYSLTFSIIMCILEVIFGFAILIGWQPKVMSWLILAMIVFFTFLTWYSAYYNKVTDCGCFGDFIKLKPWVSFYKDLILLALILVIFFRRKQIVPLFSPLFSINAMIVATLASSIFAIYCNMFLPAWDFLPYKIGNNIRQLMTPPAGARVMDSTVNVLVYKKGNAYDSVVFPATRKDTSWTFHSRVDKVIVPGWKSTIHDFGFVKMDENDIDLTDTLLKSKRFNLLIVSAHLEDANQNAWANIKALAIEAKKAGIGFYAVTSSPSDLSNALVASLGLPFNFRNSDETLLKTIVRSNPGVILWHDGIIVDKWSCRSVPSINKIKKLMKK